MELMMAQIRDLKTGIKYKNTPIGKIPVDWEVVRLRNIASKFYNGGTPDTKNKSYWDGNIPWITGADFEGQKVKYIRRYITEEGVKNSATNVVPKGNLLIVTRTGVGKLAIAPFDIAISQDITGVILDSEKALTEFIYWYLEFNASKLKLMIQGTSINGLLREDLETISFLLPPHPEQKKIAEILTTLDEGIEKTTQIIEKIKETKKGLMQQLLTRGIGHKKFKKTEIGEIPEEWEVVRLKDITQKFYNGGTPDTKIKDYWDGNIPWITGADFENQKVSQIRRYITYEGVKNSATNVIPKGNLLVVTRTGVGKLAIALFDIAISQDITGVILDSKKALPEYIYWYIDYNSNRLRSIIQGTSINGLLREDLESFPVSLPRIDEQKQIAEILSSVDREIEKESNHKEQLELLKKGLMQVLLTGKIRVSV
jgi:type I restriction enzyme S subunit